MKHIALIGLLVLSGCSLQVAELNRPYVAARMDSSKSAADFAKCAADAMGLVAREDEGITTIVRKNKIGAWVARWDFLATTNGSQAELRTGAEDDAGIELVRGCAG